MIEFVIDNDEKLDDIELHCDNISTKATTYHARILTILNGVKKKEIFEIIAQNFSKDEIREFIEKKFSEILGEKNE